MKRLILSHILALSCLIATAQTITMTNVNGGSNTNVGCGGTFVDAGGAAGAYPNTVGTFTQVFTAATATDILHLTIASLNLSQGGGPSNDDDFRVYLGVGTGGALLYDAPSDVVAADLDFYSDMGGSVTVVFIQAGTNNGPAPGWTGSIECINTLVTPLISGTTITTTGYFVDQGGLAGNMDGSVAVSGTGYYPNSAANYITICPATPGTYVSIDFKEFNIEYGYESMVILNGGISGGIIGSYTGTNSPGVVTSSSYDGCLTLWFNGDANFNAPGWLAQITNVAGRGSNSYCCETYNCSGGCGIWICVSGEFQPNTGGGQGCVEDMRNTTTQGCWGGGGEINSTWYYFSPLTSGTLGFNIAPPGGLDFDYAIWKSPADGFISCPLNTNEAPIRCSFAAANGAVGLNFTATDLSEGAAGDNWTRYMDVVAGETYMMVLNCYSNGNPQANPTWTWTGTATLSCQPVGGVLAADFSDFYGRPVEHGVELIWRTASETASDHFELLRGTTPETLEPIARLEANNAPSRYNYVDDYLTDGTYYYQVVEHDVAGRTTKTAIVEYTVNAGAEPPKVVRIVTLMGVDVTAAPPVNQVLVRQYSDGSTEKFIIVQE